MSQPRLHTDKGGKTILNSCNLQDDESAVSPMPGTLPVVDAEKGVKPAQADQPSGKFKRFLRKISESRVVEKLRELDRDSRNAGIFINVCILGICATALILGRYGQLKVEKGWKEPIPRTFVGFAVQTSAIAMVSLTRHICQIMFARAITSDKGVKFRKMVAGWSVLYSGSFRGLEDMLSALNIWSIVLAVALLGEIALLSSIGSLASMEELAIIRENGSLPLMTVVTRDTPWYDPGDASDLMVGHLDTMSSPLYKQGTFPPPDSQPYPNATRDPITGGCSVTRLSIVHPFNFSLFYPPTDITPIALPIVKEGETVIADVRANLVTVNCTPPTSFTLAKYRVAGYWEILGTLDDGRSLMSSSAFQSASIGIPEIGVSPLVINRSMANSYYVGAKGELYIAVYARNFQTGTTFKGFQYFPDPNNLTASVAVTLCSIVARPGRSVGTIYFPYIEPTTISRVDAATPFESTGDTLFTLTRGGGLATVQLLIGTLAKLSCSYWACPVINTEFAPYPWFDRATALLKRKPETQADYDNQIEVVTQVVANLSSLIFAVSTMPDTNSTGAYGISSKELLSKLYITKGCTGVLIAGIVSAILLICFYVVSKFMLDEQSDFNVGIRITDSVYFLLGSSRPVIQDDVASGTNGLALKKALTNTTVHLTRVGIRRVPDDAGREH
ncbi:hypothetical protein HK104_005973 [Borealophlyctis nickersoniae]|nr:hypothetical protein HK104_005973 [Borealophlyctis nickersoniae]